MNSFPYKHVLIIGATAGIGRALADRFVNNGIKVTAVGRRKERLDAFVQEHGTAKAQVTVFDISKTDAIPAFAEDMMKNSTPEIDCVFLNAGMQRRYDLTDPSFDLDGFQREMNVNFMSFVASVKAFLPFLQKRESGGFIFTTSNLSIIPAAPMPAYSASKAALNAFVLCLREQLRKTNVKVIELSPPAVQSELHDYMGEAVGRKIGMPLDEFTTEAYDELMSGKDQIVIGSVSMSPEHLRQIISDRRAAFEKLAEIMEKWA